MSKVVFLSWAYPPMRLPRAIQVARFANYLGRPIEVICGANPADLSAGLESSCASDRIRLTRIRRPKWHRYVDAALARSVPAALTMPDPYWGWARRAARQILHSIEFSSNDVFVSFGQPMSDHLAGLEIKRARGVPWLAHFSDPWSDNPLLKRGAISICLNRSMERRVIEAADRIVMTSEETVDLIMAKYPSALRSKVSVLPHAYDDTAYPPSSRPADDDVLVFRHLGNFYHQRTPQPLFNGIKVLLKQQPNALQGVRFELVGAFEKGLEKSLDWTGLPSGLVELIPPVAYDASLRLMVEADALLVVDAPAEISVFLPSKLVDYIGARRPILGITPPGAAANLISALGGPIADPLDPNAIADSIRQLVEQARRTGRDHVWGATEIRERYAAPVVAARFNEIIDAAANTH